VTFKKNNDDDDGSDSNGPKVVQNATVVVLSDEETGQILGTVTIPPDTIKKSWTLVFTASTKNDTGGKVPTTQPTPTGTPKCGKTKKKAVKTQTVVISAKETLSPGFDVQAYDPDGNPRDISDLPSNVEISLYAVLPLDYHKVNLFEQTFEGRTTNDTFDTLTETHLCWICRVGEGCVAMSGEDEN